VVAWGCDLWGEISVPSGLGEVSAVATGARFSLALKADGTVAASGENATGLLKPPAGLSDVVAIAGGFNHALALKREGKVVAWGWNVYGQTNVPAGLEGVVSIAAGAYHSLALKSDGTVVGWGLNDHKETEPPAGLSNVSAVAAGVGFSLALVGEGAPAGEPPSITAQPQSRTNLAGTTATFSVTASGTGPLSYQWLINGTNLVDGVRISGAASSSLALPQSRPMMRVATPSSSPTPLVP